MSFVLTALMMLYPLAYVGIFHLLFCFNDAIDLTDEVFFKMLQGYVLIGILLCILYAFCPKGKARNPLRYAVENLLVKLFAFPCDLAVFLFALHRWLENIAASKIEGVMGIGLSYFILILFTTPYAIVRLTMYSATATVRRRAVKYAQDNNPLSKTWRILHALFHTIPILDIISATILCFQLKRKKDLPELPVTSD